MDNLYCSYDIFGNYKCNLIENFDPTISSDINVSTLSIHASLKTLIANLNSSTPPELIALITALMTKIESTTLITPLQILQITFLNIINGDELPILTSTPLFINNLIQIVMNYQLTNPPEINLYDLNTLYDKVFNNYKNIHNSLGIINIETIIQKQIETQVKYILQPYQPVTTTTTANIKSQVNYTMQPYQSVLTTTNIESQ